MRRRLVPALLATVTVALLAAPATAPAAEPRVRALFERAERASSTIRSAAGAFSVDVVPYTAKGPKGRFTVSGTFSGTTQGRERGFVSMTAAYDDRKRQIVSRALAGRWFLRVDGTWYRVPGATQGVQTFTRRLRSDPLGTLRSYGVDMADLITEVRTFDTNARFMGRRHTRLRAAVDGQRLLDALRRLVEENPALLQDRQGNGPSKAQLDQGFAAAKASLKGAAIDALFDTASGRIDRLQAELNLQTPVFARPFTDIRGADIALVLGVNRFNGPVTVSAPRRAKSYTAFQAAYGRGRRPS